MSLNTLKNHKTNIKIDNNYKEKFGITSKLINTLHKELHKLYENSNINNIVKPKSIHNLINNLFITDIDIWIDEAVGILFKILDSSVPSF